MSGGYKRPYESDNPSNSRSVRGRTDRMMMQHREHEGSATSSSSSYVDDRDPRLHHGNTSASGRSQSPYNHHGHRDYRGRHGYHSRSDYHEREQSNTPSSYRSQNDHTRYRESPGNRDRSYDRGHRGRHGHHNRPDYHSNNYIDNRNRNRRPDQNTNPRNGRSNDQEPSTSRNEGRNGCGRAYEQFSRDREGQPETHFDGSTAATLSERVENGPRPERSLINETLTTKPNYVKEKHGKVGRPVNLLTNYFKILKKPTWQLYLYRVDFSPEIELCGLKNRLIYEQNNLFGRYVFDGTMLVLSRKLEGDVIVINSKDRDDNPIDITVKFARVISKNQYDFILNSILRKSISALKDLAKVRRNFFDPLNAIKDFRNHFKIELWPGYVTSIRQHEEDILLCVEITTKVMRTDTVLDILRNCYNDDEIDFKRQFESTVLGMVVLTDYNNRTYRITGVDFDRCASSTFDLKEAKPTFIEYYQNKYKIEIKDKNQPLLISKASDRELRGGQSLLIALLPELCRPTGLSDEMRSNDRLMKDIANCTKLIPSACIERLIRFNKRLQDSAGSRDNFKEWNFKLDTNLVNVSGRCLQNEKIIFGNGRQISTDKNSEWSTQPHSNHMYVSQHLNNWTIIVQKDKQSNIKPFLDTLISVGQQMGYNIRSPRFVTLKSRDTATSYVDALNEAVNGDPQLIMCIVSDQHKDRYSVIKKKCCLERAIPTQVITYRTLQRPRQHRTIATKVVIQMNSKLGGVPWMVQIDHDDLMVVGYDVCRDTKDKSKCFGAIVATMNMKLKQNYFSAIDVSTSGQQLSDNFGMNIVKAVTAYKEQHKKLPTKIVIYRDGVGEGQIKYVYEHEVKDIQAKLKEAYKDVPVQLAFVVVSKKINTRFFTTHQTNPSPGTVVDNVVTLPQRYEFFLVSQFNKQGTVSPTSYNILHDDIQFTPDQWQVLTYKMTHLYYNWCGTVSVPAVCHNAHRLAFFVANFIHDRPSNRLEKQLYFL